MILLSSSHAEQCKGTRASVNRGFADLRSEVMATSMQALDRYQISDVRERYSGERPLVREVIHTKPRFDGIIRHSAALTSLLTQLDLVAPTDATVLIQGETGTGKELL